MYNFDEITDRRNSNSYKWDSTPPSNDTDVSTDDIIPLWVADMDFRVAPPVLNALQRRVAHGIFGYTKVPEAYYEATINWFQRRHGWQIKRDSFIYTSGVVPAISAIIKAMTMPGDKVLVQTPVYNCFFSSIRNNGCQLVASELVFHPVESEDNYTYSINFEDFEQKLSDPAVKVFLLCNPHNPAGRVWTRSELLHMAQLCLKHNVFVISDEIHCELTMPGYKYTPYASLGKEFEDNAAICTSPSKAFNIAGLQIANITATDPSIRQRIDKAININEVCDVNPFGVEALIAAYNEGEPWLNQLIQYIEANYQYCHRFIKDNLPQIKQTKLEGTYLLWIDCRQIMQDKAVNNSEQLEEKLVAEAKLWLNAGSMYGHNGEGFMRINLATSKTLLAEGLKRFADWVNNQSPLCQ